jgi:hypothetical protein
VAVSLRRGVLTARAVSDCGPMSPMSTQQRTLPNGPARTARVSARVDPEILDHIGERARRADVDASHMIRRMLAYAARHMPADWLPSGDPPAARQGSARRAS